MTGTRGASRRILWGVGLAVLGALALALWVRRQAPADTSMVARSTAQYVGSETCAGCHQAEALEWVQSQHAAAMAEASDATVAGAFDDREVTSGGVTSLFFRRDGRFYVRTDGDGGQIREFEITYTFGVDPLQQYLVRFPGGRLQALGLAWDTRPAPSGGQRWFHLYPDEPLVAGDPLHWTGPQQNWNFMCADCHSTNLRKGYDAATRQFETTWSEISVGCEACHGPGSDHVDLAREGATARPDGFGLTARLDERRGVTWHFDDTAGVPVRSAARADDGEIEVCARCHSRREQLTDDWYAGERLEDGFRPSSLEAGLYFSDGQQREEVYTYASFLESLMYARGVTCSDCHNPHTGALRLSGNATCTQCHQAPVYLTADHHLHQPGSAGSLCVTCHMPTRTYMEVDPRHDHSFRVPRPDRTVAIGVPNACTDSCHADRDAGWAADAIEAAFGRPAAGSQVFAERFAAFDAGTVASAPSLASLAADAAEPAVVRAGALHRLAVAGMTTAVPFEALLVDPSPMVRRTTLEQLRLMDDDTRLRLVPGLLSDSVRTVRIEAARALADLADRALPRAARPAFERAFGEFVAEARHNGDRAEAQANLGTLWMARGRLDEAAAAFQEGTALNRTFVPAFLGLAEVHRLRGDEDAAERVLRDALAASPDSAEAHHALGLALVRQRRRDDAIPELFEATRQAPEVSRFAYVYGVALHDAGRTTDALQVLREADGRHPDDPDLLLVLALYSDEAGSTADARRYVDRLLAVQPANPTARALVSRLDAAAR